jgi:hypothetical protein
MAKIMQDPWGGKRSVECPKCHSMVVVYNANEATQVKRGGCMSCIDRENEGACTCEWDSGDNPNCPVHGKH